MAVGPKRRFEVFKRDEFTCRYCGRKTPQVVLQVDHIIPESKGGASEIENLVTSCFECNSGKGAILLSENAPVMDLEDQMILLLERERQLREYNEVKRLVRKREDSDVEDLLVYWDNISREKYGPARLFPKPGQLRFCLKKFAKEDLVEAMDIAMDRQGDYMGVKYFLGIIRNWRRDRLGEEVDR